MKLPAAVAFARQNLAAKQNEARSRRREALAREGMRAEENAESRMMQNGASEVAVISPFWT